MSLLKTNKKGPVKPKKKNLKLKEQEIKDKLSGKNYSPIVAKNSKIPLKKKNPSANRQKQQQLDLKNNDSKIESDLKLTESKTTGNKNETKNPLKRKIKVMKDDSSHKVARKEDSSMPTKKNKVTILEKTPLLLKKQIQFEKNSVAVKKAALKKIQKKNVKRDDGAVVVQESTPVGNTEVKTNFKVSLKPPANMKTLKMKPAGKRVKMAEGAVVVQESTPEGNTEVKTNSKVSLKPPANTKTLRKRPVGKSVKRDDGAVVVQESTPVGNTEVKTNFKVSLKPPANMKTLKMKPAGKRVRRAEGAVVVQKSTPEGNTEVKTNSKVSLKPSANTKTLRKRPVGKGDVLLGNIKVKTSAARGTKPLMKKEKTLEKRKRVKRAEGAVVVQESTPEGNTEVKTNSKVSLKPPTNTKTLRKKPTGKKVKSEEAEGKAEKPILMKTKKGKSITKVNINSLKKRSSLKARSLRKKGRNPERGVCVFKNIPHGFYEKQLLEYCSQFGKVTGVYHPVSTDGNSRGYAFVEFAHKEVAEVVAETMDNYVMFYKRVRCEMVPKERERPWVFKLKKTREDIAKENRETGLRQRMRQLTKPEFAAWKKRKTTRISLIHKKLSALGLDYQFKVNEKPLKINEEKQLESTHNTNSK